MRRVRYLIVPYMSMCGPLPWEFPPLRVRVGVNVRPRHSAGCLSRPNEAGAVWHRLRHLVASLERNKTSRALDNSARDPSFCNYLVTHAPLPPVRVPCQFPLAWSRSAVWNLGIRCSANGCLNLVCRMSREKLISRWLIRLFIAQKTSDVGPTVKINTATIVHTTV